MSYPYVFSTPGVGPFAEAVDAERRSQLEKWGDQRHPNATAITGDRDRANNARHVCDVLAERGMVGWRDILNEEVQEAFAESDPVKLREELIQCAAVIAAWVYDLDRDDL